MNRKVAQSYRKVTQSFKIYLCGTLRLINRKVAQSSRKVAQSFKIYLCETLRFTLRNSAVYFAKLCG
ncbi:MAG: hypothetical protein BWK80_28675 [Desulfobacteraceae bacterium IS3]|nr:MAG: hypothetical protein BWK80_28675 [Desulfobacteraceae bacterium IS3]